MQTIQVTKINDTYAQIHADTSVMKEIQSHFSFYVENYKHHQNYKRGKWDGKIRLCTIRGQLSIGLSKHLKKFADTMGYTIGFHPDIKESFNELIEDCQLDDEGFDKWALELKLHDDKKSPISPHWYQKDAVIRFVNKKRGIYELPTSAGKSLIQYMMVRRMMQYGYRTLIVVPTTTLVEQMKGDFNDYSYFDESYNDSMVKTSTDKKDVIRNIPTHNRVVITTWQTAVNQSASFFKQFQCIVTDEVHIGDAASLKFIAESCTDAMYKVGLSGTIKDSKTSKMQLIGLYGDIYKPTNTKELMDSGQITPIKMIPLMITYTPSEAKYLKGTSYADEIKFITGHLKRNEVIAKLATKHPDENVVILFRHKAHGVLLQHLLSKITNQNVMLLNGDTDVNSRMRVKTTCEASTGNILLASIGVFATGTSIKNLHCLIKAHPTKSKVVALQSIGRVLRKHFTKKYAKVIDVIDDLSYKKHQNYALKHGISRVNLYDQEGFDYVVKRIRL